MSNDTELESANIKFNFTLENINFTENKSFHIYVIKSNKIPFGDFLENPGICCSERGGFVCDGKFIEKKKDTYSKMLKDNSLFFRDYFFTGNYTKENFNKIFVNEVI